MLANRGTPRPSRRGLTRLALVGVCTGVSLWAGACGQPLPSVFPTSTSSPSAPSSAAPAVPSTLPAPSQAPAGSTLRTIDSLRLRLAVPEGWVVLDAARGESDPALVAVARASKTTPGDVVSLLRRAKVVKLVPADSADISAAAVDLRVVKRKALPTQAEVDAEISSFGGTTGELASVPTPAGPAVRVPYVLQRGSSTSACEILVLDDGTRLVSASTAMASIPKVEALTTLVETTITSTPEQ